MLKIKYSITCLLMLCNFLNYAQTNKTFFLGHSLVNFEMPNMVNKLSIAASKNYTYNLNVGNGANLQYHWTNPTTGQGDQWNLTLPLGGFENFIVTEAVPLAGHLQWSNTYRIADSLYRFAKLQNPNIQYYIYETWHCNKSGNGSTTGIGGYPCDWDPQSITAWRTRLTIDLPKWEGIADSINLLHTKPMLVIPVGQALAQLNDSIIAGNVPGLTSINQLFSDDIHLTLTGNYFVACVMYGVIHKTSPVGLPNQLTDQWGTPYSVFPTAIQAAAFQRIAWRTLLNYPRDGVNAGVLSNNLLSVEGKCNEQGVTLKWKTVAANNSNLFVVEKSVDAVNFESIKTINVASNYNQTNTYAYEDLEPKTGVTYYRIKQIYDNGNIKYSNIIETNCPISSHTVSVYPNPATNILQVNLANTLNAKSVIEISNATGQILLNKKITAQHTVFNIRHFTAGIYFVKVVNDNKQTIKKIIVK